MHYASGWNFQVLIKVEAAGINPVDTYIRSGTYAVKPTLPYTPGKDVAGVVEDVGAKVQHLKVRVSPERERERERESIII